MAPFAPQHQQQVNLALFLDAIASPTSYHILKPISFKSEFCTVVAELKPVAATQTTTTKKGTEKEEEKCGEFV